MQVQEHTQTNERRDNQHDQGLEDRLTPSAAAKLLNLSTGTLGNYRIKGIGPKYLKLGKGPRAPVRYRRGDLLDWVDANERTSTTE